MIIEKDLLEMAELDNKSQGIETEANTGSGLLARLWKKVVNVFNKEEALTPPDNVITQTQWDKVIDRERNLTILNQEPNINEIIADNQKQLPDEKSIEIAERIRKHVELNENINRVAEGNSKPEKPEFLKGAKERKKLREQIAQQPDQADKLLEEAGIDAPRVDTSTLKTTLVATQKKERSIDTLSR